MALLALVLLTGALVGVALKPRDSSPTGTPAGTGGGSAFGGGPGRREPSLTEAAGAGRPVESGTRLAAVPRLPASRGVAQLFAVGFSGRAVDAPFFARLARRDWGAVLLSRANAPSRDAIGPLARQVMTVARAARHVAPLVIGARDLPLMPPLKGRTPAQARSAAAGTAGAYRRAGVTMVLSPIADVGYASGPAAGVAFSDDPVRVARASRSAIDGWRGGGVAPVPGSYPGEGAASGDPGVEVSTVGLSLAELEDADLRVYRAIRARTPVIQMSDALYAAWDGVTPATLLPEAVGRLRDDGFRGVVLSGDLVAATLATGGGVGEAAVDALRAGCDLLLVPGDRANQEEAFRAVYRAVRSGRITAARYRDALARVSALKRAYKVR